jgi:nucleoside-diphosphate-sugar epimerase
MTSNDKPVAAITGGTGFLGRYIIQSLTQAGWKVRLLIRKEPIHPLNKDMDAELVLGDLSNQNALERLCLDADVVVHAAGLIKAKSRADFFDINAEGSARVALAAAKTAPNPHIIGISSLAAREPTLSDYAASKHAGEAELRKHTHRTVTILRPSAIYGRWDRETLSLFQMASKGIVFTPNVPNARVCLVNATDVAAAVTALARAPGEDAVYELCDENVHGYTWHEMAAEAGRAFGKSPKTVHLHPTLLKSAGYVSEKLARITGRTPMLTSGKMREILHADWGSSTNRQPSTNLWQPKVNLAQGFKETAAWYEENKWL